MKKDEGKNITIDQMRELVSQQSWVMTPYRYSELGAGLTLIQQQALFMVSEHLRCYIKNFYNLHLDKQKNTPKPLFSDHVIKEGIPPFRIYLADMGILPSNYKDARQAIEEINLQVEHPELDGNGNRTGRTLLTNVFSQFGFEDTGDYYHFTNKEDGTDEVVKRKNPYIDVKINPDVAMWAFDMSRGYVNHLKLIAAYSTKRPTPRIYLMLLSRMKPKQSEATIRISLIELKKYLGIVPYKDKASGEFITPYPKFANFRQKVLDAVKDDLDRMATENHTDITFTYELYYPGTRKKGDPEAIIFHVSRTTLGTAYNVVINHAKLPETKITQQDMFVSEYFQIWKALMDDVLANCQDEVWKNKFKEIQFESYDQEKKTLLLVIHGMDFHKWLESDDVINFFAPFVRKHFKSGIKVQYRVLE